MHFDFIGSVSVFCLFVFNKAMVTLILNHHGLTLYQTTLNVEKLKTSQLQEKIVKLRRMSNYIQSPPMSQLKVYEGNL